MQGSLTETPGGWRWERKKQRAQVVSEQCTSSSRCPDPCLWPPPSSELCVGLWFRAKESSIRLELYKNGLQSGVGRSGGYVWKGALEFPSKEISNSISCPAGPPLQVPCPLLLSGHSEASAWRRLSPLSLQDPCQDPQHE